MPSLKVTILVPKFYNDGTQVEINKHRKTAQELTKKFNGCTQENSPLIGKWKDESGKEFNDINFVFWVVCKNSSQNRLFLKKYKKKLKKRYDQKEIMMYSVSIDPI